MGSRLSSMMANVQKINHPIVVVLGATGTGKSKLAIDLAKKYNGEIISADSIQVYRGLDIVTNKVTNEEAENIPHHFIGCMDSLARFTVVDFKARALPVIDNILKSQKLPIIVGGTNYYIESLLWEVLLKPEEEMDENELMLESEKKRLKLDNDISKLGEKNSEMDFANKFENLSDSTRELLKVDITQDSFTFVSSEVLHKALEEVDPTTASTLHPNDKRKIIRSLQVYQKHKCRQSDLLIEQRSQKGGSSLGGPLRFKNAVMLWIQCEREVLNKRLFERVDKMLANGLIKELLDFHKVYNENRITDDGEPRYNEGIFQSIGFKEFHEYLVLPDDQKDSPEGKKLLDSGIERMKIQTRKYARKQDRWVHNRFLRAPDRDLPPVYGLDGTDLSLWDENVSKLASRIVEAKIEGTPCDISPLPIEPALNDVKETYHCDICDRVIIGSKTWLIHLDSNKHYDRKISLKKKALIAEALKASSESTT